MFPLSGLFNEFLKDLLHAVPELPYEDPIFSETGAVEYKVTLLGIPENLHNDEALRWGLQKEFKVYSNQVFESDINESAKVVEAITFMFRRTLPWYLDMQVQAAYGYKHLENSMSTLIGDGNKSVNHEVNLKKHIKHLSECGLHDFLVAHFNNREFEENGQTMLAKFAYVKESANLTFEVKGQIKSMT
jgi:hypothetical protein